MPPLFAFWVDTVIALPYDSCALWKTKNYEILTVLIFTPPSVIRIRLILIALFKEGKWAQI